MSDRQHWGYVWVIWDTAVDHLGADSPFISSLWMTVTNRLYTKGNNPHETNRYRIGLDGEVYVRVGAKQMFEGGWDGEEGLMNIKVAGSPRNP